MHSVFIFTILAVLSVMSLAVSVFALVKLYSSDALETDWVICRYKEDLSWMKRVLPLIPKLRRVFIYNKGEPLDANLLKRLRSKTRANIHEYALPNIGREGNAYLVHIVRFYDAMSPMTLFTQGKLFEPGDPKKYASLLFRPGAYAIHVKPFDMKPDDTHGARFPDDEKLYPGITRCKLTVGEFAKKYFYMDVFPEHASFTGCFKTTRDKLHKYSRADYQRILQETGLGSEKNPEEGFYLERLWYAAVCQ